MAEQSQGEGRSANGLSGFVPIVIAAALFAWFATLLPQVAAGDVLRWSIDWVPSQGIALAFLLDGLSLTFALLISGIGTLVLLYSNTYLQGHAQYGRFALYLTSFMLAMLGLVLADDLIGLFVFWELTTFTSYLLIGFSHESGKSRRNALQALFITGAGGLAFLAGLILLGLASGTSSISGIIAQGDALRAHALYLPILVLIFAGALTKSAQVPFHFWLPNAMAAPTPVSAFLHSATMVKAGIYILARMHPAMSGTDAWFWVLTILGAITAVFASLQSLRQTDLKQALAWTTLMALGTLTLLLGQDSRYALTGFATFLVVHSLYKASLFLVVGNIDKATGTREVARLGKLARAMPVTAAAAALAALSMAGLPPFLGFIGKELKYAGALASPDWPAFVAGAALLANALMFAVAAIVALRPFWTQAPEAAPRPAQEVPWQMLAGPAVLAALGLGLGLMPGLLQGALIDPTVAAMSGGAAEAAKLTLWHGVNLPLILSGATFALGLVLYLLRNPLRTGLNAAIGALPDLDAKWDRFMDGLKGFAEWQSARIQNGRLSWYLGVTFFTIAAALVLAILGRGMPVPRPDFAGVAWEMATIAVLLVAGAGVAIVTASRMTAIAGLGVSGIAMSMIFLVFSAPDVAITQLLVETLIVVMVAMAMLRLPELRPMGFHAGRAAVALALGGAVTVILLSVLSQPLDLRLTDYFNAASYPEAHGRNIVNVILVDFRAIDTFGEIAVVTIAALSVFALLRVRKGADK